MAESLAYHGWVRYSLIETPAVVSVGVDDRQVMRKSATLCFLLLWTNGWWWNLQHCSCCCYPKASKGDWWCYLPQDSLHRYLQASKNRWWWDLRAARGAASMSSNVKWRVVVGLMAFPAIVEFQSCSQSRVVCGWWVEGSCWRMKNKILIAPVAFVVCDGSDNDDNDMVYDLKASFWRGLHIFCRLRRHFLWMLVALSTSGGTAGLY